MEPPLYQALMDGRLQFEIELEDKGPQGVEARIEAFGITATAVSSDAAQAQNDVTQQFIEKLHNNEGVMERTF